MQNLCCGRCAQNGQADFIRIKHFQDASCKLDGFLQRPVRVKSIPSCRNIVYRKLVQDPRLPISAFSRELSYGFNEGRFSKSSDDVRPRKHVLVQSSPRPGALRVEPPGDKGPSSRPNPSRGGTSSNSSAGSQGSAVVRWPCQKHSLIFYKWCVACPTVL
jgi:hypothetical protein